MTAPTPSSYRSDLFSATVNSLNSQSSNSSNAGSDGSTLYYGVFVGVLELCAAVDAHSRVIPQLDFLKLLRLRISNQTLSFNSKAGIVNASMIPQDVWNLIVEELIREEVEDAVKLLSNGLEVNILENHVESIRTHLIKFNLLLPSTQTFEFETGESKPLLVPVASSYPVEDSDTALLVTERAINIGKRRDLIPFTAQPQSFAPTLQCTSDFSVPMQRDTSPSVLTLSMLNDAVLVAVPQEVTRRFEHLIHLQQLSFVNGIKSDNSLTKRILLFKI